MIAVMRARERPFLLLMNGGDYSNDRYFFEGDFESNFEDNDQGKAMGLPLFLFPAPSWPFLP